MDKADRERRGDEVPRVRVRAGMVPGGDPTRAATDPLRSALRDAENTFLSLQRRAAEGALPEALSGYRAILSDLRVVSIRLREMSGHRDISYLADRRLTTLGNYCLWLTRRVSAEFLLILQIYFEQELKRLISPDAYRMYLRLEDVADVAREVEMLDDRTLMARLRDGSLLEQVVPQDPPPWLQSTSATAE